MGAGGFSSGLGSESWRGRSEETAPPPRPTFSLCSRHLVVGLVCTSQGSGAGSFSPSLHSEMSFWEISGQGGAECFASFTGFYCYPGNYATEICCSTRSFAWACFFPFLHIWLLLLKYFAWSEQSIIIFSPKLVSPVYFSPK